MSRFYTTEFTLFYTLADHLFEDSAANIIKNKHEFNIDDYNSIQKSIFNLLTGSAGNNIYGKNNIKLFEYEDILVLKNMKDNSLILFEDFELKKDGNESLNNALQEPLKLIYETLQQNSEDSYFQRFKHLKDNMKEVSEIEMSDTDLKNFIELTTHSYTANKIMSCESLNDIIAKKLNLNQDITLESNDSFYKHYKNIESIVYFDLFEYKSDHERYERISNFLNNDLRMDSIIPVSLDESSAEYKFITVKKNNKAIGGFSMENKEDYYNIYSIDLIESENNKENYIDILNKLSTLIENDKKILVRTDYSKNQSFKDAVDSVDNYMYIKDRKDIDNFENLIVLLHENGVKNAEKDIVIKSFDVNNSDRILINTQKNIHKIKEKIENMDRVQFNYLMMANNCKESNKNFDLLGFDSKNNSFKSEEGDLNIIKEKITSSLNSLNINLDMFQNIALEDDLNKKAKMNILDDCLDYKFNYLYDFLSEQNIIKNRNKVKLYRLESSPILEDKGNERGLYNIDILNSTKVDTYIEDRYDRRMPHNEPLIKEVFNRDYQDYSDQKQWFFAFKNKEQMTSWFEESILKDMENKHNVKVVVYETEERFVIGNHKQSIFQKDKSKKINEMKISDLLENKTVKQSIKNKIKNY